MDHTPSLITSLLITAIFWGCYYAYCKFSFQEYFYTEEEEDN